MMPAMTSGRPHARQSAKPIEPGSEVQPNQRNWSSIMKKLIKSEEGAMGYLLAWAMGVPASVLLVIFLIRGH